MNKNMICVALGLLVVGAAGTLDASAAPVHARPIVAHRVAAPAPAVVRHVAAPARARFSWSWLHFHRVHAPAAVRVAPIGTPYRPFAHLPHVVVIRRDC